MTAEILAPTRANIDRAGATLRRGHLVGMPTETVYGLAGNALDERAVARIFAAKARPHFDPLIVHVAPSAPSLAALGELGVVDVARLGGLAGARAQQLIEAFWPGPLTLVLPRGPAIPDLVTSGLPRVAVRMPRHPVAQALIRAAGVPLAAPSANRFGRISPTQAAHVVAELGERVEVVLDGGPCEVGLESTVLALDGGGAVLLRPGGLPAEAIEAVLGAPILHASKAVGDAPAGPGMLASHYAPRKALHLIDSGDSLPKDLLAPVVGVLARRGDPAERARAWSSACGAAVRVEVLSAGGDVGESARRLFGCLRALDASDAELLFAESWPQGQGLTHAIRDRLERAAAARP